MSESSEFQAAAWTILYDQIKALLRNYGVEDHFGKDDYLIVDDNLGYKWHTIEIHRLHMLRCNVVKALQALLRQFPDWELIVAVDIPGTEGVWPPMGLTIRSNEIIDGLQRRFFPKEFQNIQYEGSRPGTDRD